MSKFEIYVEILTIIEMRPSSRSAVVEQILSVHPDLLLPDILECINELLEAKIIRSTGAKLILRRRNAKQIEYVIRDDVDRNLTEGYIKHLFQPERSKYLICGNVTSFQTNYWLGSHLASYRLASCQDVRIVGVLAARNLSA